MTKTNPKKENTRAENAETVMNEGTRHPRKKPEPHQVAVELINRFGDEIVKFIESDASGRLEMCKTLFKMPSFPNNISVSVNGELREYEMYQVERNTWMKPELEGKFTHMSTSIVLIDPDTHRPEFFMNATIHSNESAHINVYCMGSYGIDYRRTVQWVFKNGCSYIK